MSVVESIIIFMIIIVLKYVQCLEIILIQEYQKLRLVYHLVQKTFIIMKKYLLNLNQKLIQDVKRLAQLMFLM